MLYNNTAVLCYMYTVSVRKDIVRQIMYFKKEQYFQVEKVCQCTDASCRMG